MKSRGSAKPVPTSNKTWTSGTEASICTFLPKLESCILFQVVQNLSSENLVFFRSCSSTSTGSKFSAK
ncbi:unnamed protein product [Larinioides sclopetarius]|uniref:Uncharacterized protein n=1 Tax=Larinioides sclopetarius TaxID=280406 RepID=A0AAV2BAJ5_9ARAC